MDNNPYSSDWLWDDYFITIEYFPKFLCKCKTCGVVFDNDNDDTTAHYNHLKCANLKPVEYPQHTIEMLLNGADIKTKQKVMQYKTSLEDWYRKNANKK